MQTGESIGGLRYNMAGSFLVFRGVKLSSQSIDEWHKARDLVDGVGTPLTVNMPGYTSCSESYRVALQFALNQSTFQSGANEAQASIPVLFVIACQNYMNFNGIRLVSHANSAYPAEQELLLMEGCEVHVLQIQRDFLILS